MKHLVEGGSTAVESEHLRHGRDRAHRGVTGHTAAAGLVQEAEWRATVVVQRRKYSHTERSDLHAVHAVHAMHIGAHDAAVFEPTHTVGEAAEASARLS